MKTPRRLAVLLLIAAGSCGGSVSLLDDAGRLAASSGDDVARVLGRRPPPSFAMTGGYLDDVGLILRTSSDDAASALAAVPASAPAQSRAASALERIRTALSTVEADAVTDIVCAAKDALEDGQLMPSDVYDYLESQVRSHDPSYWSEQIAEAAEELQDSFETPTAAGAAFLVVACFVNDLGTG